MTLLLLYCGLVAPFIVLWIGAAAAIVLWIGAAAAVVLWIGDPVDVLWIGVVAAVVVLRIDATAVAL